MASLSDTQIRNTYVGLLKTDDNTQLNGTLKVISDGGGTSSALRLSNDTVNANSLSVESVVVNEGLTKMLMWNDSTKDVEYKVYNPTGVTSFNTASIAGGGGGATAQIDSSSAILTINAGANIQITGSGSSIDIATSLGDAAEQVSMDLTATDVNAGAGDFYQQIDFEFRDYQNALTKSSIIPTGGLSVGSVTNSTGGRDFTLDGGSVTWVVSNSTGGGSAGNLTSSKDLTQVTTADLRVLVDVSLICTVFPTEAQRTITLPPPYVGRKIEVFFTSSPTTGGSYPEPQDMDEPLRFEIAASSTKDPNPRTCGFAGRAVLYASHDATQRSHQAFGKSSKKDYLKFQDTSESEINSAGDEVPAANKTVRGALTATRFVLYGISNDCYLCDIETFANYGTEVVDCRIIDN